MKTKGLILFILSLTLILTSCNPPEQAQEPKPYEATWESLAEANMPPEWFKDAKFGIYFHWGVYSVPAYGSEWYPRTMHIKDKDEHKHHVETYGDPSEFGYHDFVPMFTGEHFDADNWAKLFSDAGAKFAGPVAEHHDGFSMWASEVNPWNAKDMGPEVDVVGEMASAVRKYDMKLITSFHHARNLQRMVDSSNNVYEEAFWDTHYIPVDGWPTASNDSLLRVLYGNLTEDEFNHMWMQKLKEVIEAYSPDIIWFDSWLDVIPEKLRQEFMAYYLNDAQEQGKEVLVTYKQTDLPDSVAILDLEKGRMNKKTDYWWLTDDTMSKGSWSFTENLDLKSTKQLVHILIDIVSKNGVLLLNVSPKSNGIIPEDQRERLLGMGEWLKQYGEAIYSTRPYDTLGEGPTRLSTGGGFTHLVDGYLQYTPEDIRYTQSKDGKTIYAIVMGDLETGSITTLKSFLKFSKDVKNVSLIGHEDEISWMLDENGLAITNSVSDLNEIANVYKIELN